MIIWFTGLSGSGKTTLSKHLKEILEKSGFSVFHVDGDIFRSQKKKENSFSKKDIIENNRSIISHCSELANDYDFILVSVISPYEKTRKEAKNIFKDKYLEIYLNCPLEVLVKNDIKGLYRKARLGEIKNFIGFSEGSPYEKPENSNLEIKTDKVSIEDSLNKILDILGKNYGIKL